MSWALFELYARTGEDRFRDAACRAVVYERSLFSPEAGNWRDLRDATPSFPVAWCHGAAGIGLSRLAASRCCDDRDVRADLETALKTSAVSFGNNHSLCHGDFGNLELLVQSGDTARHDEANRIVAAILERGRRDGWRCGTPMEVESPGLMTGLAGIGYGLLRVADPARTPCVLVLEGTRD